MNRISALASRPVCAGLAIRIAILLVAANAGFFAVSALRAAPAAMRVVAGQSVLPVIVPIDSLRDCRVRQIETDDGYGVRGTESRKVCG